MVVDNICCHSFFAQIDENSIIVDLGANHGEFAHSVIQRYGSRVFSAEPVPELAERITRHPRLTLLPVALSGAVGTMRINVYPDRCASGFDQYEGERAGQTIDTDTVTLAEFRRRNGIGRINLLKIDIEGAELDMFAAAADAEFADIDQITIEFHDFLYPETRPAVEAVKRRLQHLGFHMLPFSLDNTDVLFVNPKAGVGWRHRLWARTAVKYGRGIRRRLQRLT
ncbi:FkbM family methyltransferase [Azospirillum fermentarium]|uniref:FkbM family methyltransferase n=1 Tax=Azospirillum fermentarium TaxID=1233114 RepID=UPI0022263F71|nr:FkbM family methyltransferase [Azospirillum fermentarium]MCW2247152.1 FkbM family methyltransferase [Azospirillum fermentarium]